MISDALSGNREVVARGLETTSEEGYEGRISGLFQRDIEVVKKLVAGPPDALHGDRDMV